MASPPPSPLPDSTLPPCWEAPASRRQSHHQQLMSRLKASATEMGATRKKKVLISREDAVNLRYTFNLQTFVPLVGGALHSSIQLIRSESSGRNNNKKINVLHSYVIIQIKGIDTELQMQILNIYRTCARRRCCVCVPVGATAGDGGRLRLYRP